VREKPADLGAQRFDGQAQRVIGWRAAVGRGVT